jgi:hypothetical protein
MLYPEKDGVLYYREDVNDRYEILLGEQDNTPFVLSTLIEDILNIKPSRSRLYQKAVVPRGAVHLGNGHMYPLHLLLATRQERCDSASRQGFRPPPEEWVERSKRRVFKTLGIEALVDMSPEDEGWRDTQRLLALDYIFEEKEGLLSKEAWELIEGTPGIECKGQFEDGYHVRVTPKVAAL